MGTGSPSDEAILFKGKIIKFQSSYSLLELGMNKCLYIFSMIRHRNFAYMKQMMTIGRMKIQWKTIGKVFFGIVCKIHGQLPNHYIVHCTDPEMRTVYSSTFPLNPFPLKHHIATAPHYDEER